MTKNKILIWNTFELIERRGGPSTYLYNLRKSVKENGIDTVDFLDDFKLEKEEKSVIKRFINEKIKPIFTINPKLRIKKNILSFLFNQEEELPKNLDINKYTHIHFHTTFDLYKKAKILKDFQGKILLTSHSPKAMHKEVFEDWLNGVKIEDVEKESVEKIDSFAFSKADYVIFPCKEAQEPYFNSWENYKNIKFKNEIKELLTCCVNSKIKLSKQEVFSKYNIPEEAFIVTYFGRHNEVKGYDVLKELGEKILPKYNNVYFLIAGKEEPLSGLKHERWIEVGWTQDPHSLVSASDLYILPNKETYFDLALLEVLSIGTTCLLSETGGNKFFKRLPEEETRGILFFDQKNINDLENKFEHIYTNKFSKEFNNELFKKYFSNINFAPNYLNLIGELK